MTNENNNIPTGLYWQGKRTEVEKISLPFQTIETINESRATREKEKGTFAAWMKKEEDRSWYNRLIWGDNKYVMSSLLDEFAGKIDLIYIDPPFATGADFSVKIEVGDVEWTKEPSAIEEKAYRDTWGKGLDSYLQMMYERLVLMRDLLSEKGSICVHCDWHAGHHLKIILDEIFSGKFLNEIIWHYRTGNIAEKILARRHDIIFVFSKTDINYFKPFEIKEYYKDIYGPNFKPSFKGRKAGKDGGGNIVLFMLMMFGIYQQYLHWEMNTYLTTLKNLSHFFNA
jgi:adenine specific DNA methylase Mod